MFNFIEKLCTIWILSIGFSFLHILMVLIKFWNEIVPLHSPSNYEIYDYIIVGAGTAGTTLLTGLNNEAKILIIEAGSSTIPFIMDIPALTPIFHQTIYDWNYQTISQLSSCKAMKNSQCSFILGKGYGGSNILNNLIYYRGDSEDFRGWFSEYEKYNYTEEIEPLFLKNEEIFQPTQLNYISKFGKEIINISTIPRLKFVIPKVLQRNGWRHAQDKISNEFLLKLSNIEWLTNAIVTKILFDKSKLRAIGLNYEKSNKMKIIYARKGVILSAGTIGTPKILLQSGIGSCNELKKLNIECILNLPGVGRNLQDHLAIGMNLIQINETLNLKPLKLLTFQNLYQYFQPFTNDKGPLSTVGCDALGFLDNGKKIGFMIMPVGITVDYGVKLRHVFNVNDEIWKNYFSKLLNVQTISILPILLHPKSRGYIKLKNSNSKSSPLINPNYLSHKDDVNDLIESIEWLKKILNTNEMKNLNATINNIKMPKCENYEYDTRDYWKCYVHQMSFSVYHPIGTCKMGDENDNETVVNKRFQVKNIENLYIVDASIMPNLPSGNPNAVVSMLARKFIEIYGK